MESKYFYSTFYTLHKKSFITFKENCEILEHDNCRDVAVKNLISAQKDEALKNVLGYIHSTTEFGYRFANNINLIEDLIGIPEYERSVISCAIISNSYNKTRVKMTEVKMSPYWLRSFMHMSLITLWIKLSDSYCLDLKNESHYRDNCLLKYISNIGYLKKDMIKNPSVDKLIKMSKDPFRYIPVRLRGIELGYTTISLYSISGIYGAIVAAFIIKNDD